MIHALGKTWIVRTIAGLLEKLTRRAVAAKPAGEEGTIFIKTLQGLAYENTGALGRAAEAYAAVLGKAADPGNGEHIREARLAAIGIVRKFYDSDLGGRRRGVWGKSETGDWLVVETARFRIHHRNVQAARRVADAMEFHFDRLAPSWDGRPKVSPGRNRGEVYLHKDQAAFRQGDGAASGCKRGIHHPKTGNKLEAQEIHLHQADPILLSTSLPHELMHLMAAALVEYKPIAAAVSEGLALHAEPRCRELQFARLFAELNQPGTLTPCSMSRYPPDRPGFLRRGPPAGPRLLAHGSAGGVLRDAILRWTVSAWHDQRGSGTWPIWPVNTAA